MRTLPRLHAVLIAANEVRRRGEPLEVLRLEPRLPIRRGQLGERIRPRPPSEALPAAREYLGRRHALAPDDSPGTRAARGAPSRASVSPDTRASYARRVAARFDPTRRSEWTRIRRPAARDRLPPHSCIRGRAVASSSFSSSMRLSGATGSSRATQRFRSRPDDRGQRVAAEPWRVVWGPTGPGFSRVDDGVDPARTDSLELVVAAILERDP
jgi:hypothetical protein